MSYTREITLDDNEIPAKVNVETGELTTLKPKRKTKLPKGKSKLNYKTFQIVNAEASKLLISGLTKEELGLVYVMIQMSEYNSNSLDPLTDETSMVKLSEHFGVDRERIGKLLKRLFEAGVYNTYTYFSATYNRKVTSWVLSPYVSWRGKTVDDSLFEHFKDTNLAKALLTGADKLVVGSNLYLK
jgi:reverse gyrase